ncbi:metalloendopeptidase [Aureococcus anophagefferens]|nr:metalloendopeptidase [Aureococcus anophagefferens]
MPTYEARSEAQALLRRESYGKYKSVEIEQAYLGLYLGLWPSDGSRYVSFLSRMLAVPGARKSLLATRPPARPRAAPPAPRLRRRRPARDSRGAGRRLRATTPERPPAPPKRHLRALSTYASFGAVGAAGAACAAARSADAAVWAPCGATLTRGCYVARGAAVCISTGEGSAGTSRRSPGNASRRIHGDGQAADAARRPGRRGVPGAPRWHSTADGWALLAVVKGADGLERLTEIDAAAEKKDAEIFVASEGGSIGSFASFFGEYAVTHRLANAMIAEVVLVQGASTRLLAIDLRVEYAPPALAYLRSGHLVARFGGFACLVQTLDWDTFAADPRKFAGEHLACLGAAILHGVFALAPGHDQWVRVKASDDGDRWDFAARTYGPAVARWISCSREGGAAGGAAASASTGSTSFGLDHMGAVRGGGCGVADLEALAAGHARDGHLRCDGYRVDVERGVAIAGHSWGGYLALLAATRPRDSPFSCAVASAGIADWAAQQKGTDVRYYDRWLMDGWVYEPAVAKRAARASPDPKALALPLLLVHGAGDTDVPFAQAKRQRTARRRPARTAAELFEHGPRPARASIGDRRRRETIDALRAAGRLARRMLDFACSLAAPGVSTDAIDAEVHEAIVAASAYPRRTTTWASRNPSAAPNEVICHGIPDSRILEEGDIVSFDVSIYADGVFGDNCGTVAVGAAGGGGEALVATTQRALDDALATVKPGACLTAIGDACADAAATRDYGVVRQYCGHGIGRVFHAPPLVQHCRNRDAFTLVPGHVFTIEPMLTERSPELYVADDGWTVVRSGAAPRSSSTVLVTDDGHEVLTLPE